MNLELFLDSLENGTERSAKKIDGKWIAQTDVKETILSAFKMGILKEFDGGFVDKNNLPPRKFKIENKIRLVPGGSAIRRGAFIAEGVIVMPPSYINIGAYIDTGTLIDSHVLVGSCAQIGKNVHLSAGVQIGGVLEPIGSTPVVVEDNAFIGAGAIIVEGIQVSEGSVIAPGVVLSKGIPIYDCVNEKIIPPGDAIPPNAVVVSGSRPNLKSKFAMENNLHVQCALIIKYKDDKTSSALLFEDLLR